MGTSEQADVSKQDSSRLLSPRQSYQGHTQTHAPSVCCELIHYSKKVRVSLLDKHTGIHQSHQKTCWVPFPLFSSLSQLKGKGGLLFRSPLNTFFISLICAPPSLARSPRGSGNVSPNALSGQGFSWRGSEHVERARKRHTERVSSRLRQASARAAPRRCQKHLNLKHCVCVCVCIITLIRDFRVDLCPCLFPDLHYTSLYTPITGYDRVHTL